LQQYSGVYTRFKHRLSFGGVVAMAAPQVDAGMMQRLSKQLVELRRVLWVVLRVFEEYGGGGEVVEVSGRILGARRRPYNFIAHF
jgi:ribosomal protein S3